MGSGHLRTFGEVSINSFQFLQLHQMRQSYVAQFHEFNLLVQTIECECQCVIQKVVQVALRDPFLLQYRESVGVERVTVKRAV